MYRNRTFSVAAFAGGAGLAALLVFPAEGLGPTRPAGAGDPTDPKGRPALHPFRLSIADVQVTASGMEVTIRFFWDDLQFALMERTSDMDFRLAETDEVDGVVQRYINEMFVIRDDGGPVIPGTVRKRGIEEALIPDEVMWWYRLDYPLPATVERIRVRNRLLFNMFEDQRNIVHLKTRSGKERAYTFGWDRDSLVAGVT